MKVDKFIPEQEKEKTAEVVPIKTSIHVDSIIPHKGHILFEINPVTGKCTLAEFESVDVNLRGRLSTKVIAKHNCVYVSALNKKNALIKYFKMVGKQIEKMNKK